MRLSPLGNLSLALLTTVLAASTANGQAAARDDSQQFRLDIAEKHIVEAPFERHLDAEMNAADLRLRVGAGVSAERIDVTLRGVTGDVSFRATLADIRRRLARSTERPAP